MSSRAQQSQLLKDPTFQAQVSGALLAASSQILNESVTTANHENRLRWANAIFASPDQQTAFFVPGVLTNPTVAAAAGNTPLPDSGTPVSDGDIDYVVASLFDVYANQYAAQQNIGSALQMGQ